MLNLLARLERYRQNFAVIKMTFEHPDANLRVQTDILPKIKLRLLATTDLHAHVLSWNYDTNKMSPARGLSRIATLIETARAEVENCLLFDNGDFLNGSGLSEAIWTGGPDRANHPIIAAMNHLKYDAVALGNHEFSHGIDFLKTCVAHADFPILCSNFLVPDLDRLLPHILMTRHFRDETGVLHQIKIGVMALLPLQTMVWESRNLQGLATGFPMLQTAQTLSKQLRDNGADVVVALAHSGFAADADATQEENLAKSLSEIGAIDAVISGHSHCVYPITSQTSSAAAAIVCAGFYGSHLGVIDLDLQRSAQGWRAIGGNSAVRPVAQRSTDGRHLIPVVQEHPEIVAIAQETHAQIIAAADQIIGQTDQRLHSYFALVADSPALNLIAAAQVDHLCTHWTQSNCGDVPILAAVAPFKAGGRGGSDNYTDLAAGPLRIRNISDLYPHPNHLVAFKIRGAELRQWLERSVSLFLQVGLGDQDAPLIDPDFPSFNFEVIFGITYEVNLSYPPRFDALGREIDPTVHRIENLKYQGLPIGNDQVFVLASNSFRRDGTAGFAGTDSSRVVYESCCQVGPIIQRYLQNGDAPPPIPPQRWTFSPMKNTTVLYDSGMAAIDVIDDIVHFRPKVLGALPSGSCRFRLHL